MNVAGTPCIIARKLGTVEFLGFSLRRRSRMSRRVDLEGAGGKGMRDYASLELKPLRKYKLEQVTWERRLCVRGTALLSHAVRESGIIQYRLLTALNLAKHRQT